MHDTEATTIDVAPGQQRVGRRVPQPLDLLVDRGVLLDVGVGLRDVRLGLVVVVVGDEVLDGVVRQQLAELVGELRRERLVRAPCTSVGRCTCSISQAVVADLPVPVAPSRTTSFSPALTAPPSSAIACGWSPLGSKSLTTWKGATVRWMSVVGRMAPP